MKQTICIALALIGILFLSACGSPTNPPPQFPTMPGYPGHLTPGSIDQDKLTSPGQIGYLVAHYLLYWGDFNNPINTKDHMKYLAEMICKQIYPNSPGAQQTCIETAKQFIDQKWDVKDTDTFKYEFEVGFCRWLHEDYEKHHQNLGTEQPIFEEGDQAVEASWWNPWSPDKKHKRWCRQIFS